jgi:NADPH-dependent curcumin reductase CurA
VAVGGRAGAVSDQSNRQILLAECPADRLELGHFRAETSSVPEPAAGEVLCRTILLSIDPASRAWMQGRTYRAQLGAGDVMAGFAVCEVVASRADDVPAGAIVACESGWQEYAALPASDVRQVRVRGPLSHHLSALGITGLTAYFGVHDIGRPARGETVLISAAAGATGNVAGQLARIAGARVVGVTGSDDKNRRIESELGFDATVNHRNPSFRDDVKAACPDGIDVYFDNVGGHVLETALARMNLHGRVVCCGAVSQYDTGSPEPGPRGVPGLLAVKRLRMEGFLVMDYVERWPEAEERLAGWIAGGRLKVLEDVVDGLDVAPAALTGLLAGDNLGKRLVRVAPDP